MPGLNQTPLMLTAGLQSALRLTLSGLALSYRC
jgi:hypothetical protein